MLKPILTAAAAIIALPALVPDALAQNAPAHLRPTRDVSVTYRMEGGGMPQPQEMRMAWDVSNNRQRVDPPGGQGWMLVDRKANTAVMVMDAQRMVMQMPPATVGAMTQDPPAGTAFTAKGTDRVAGQACNLWETTTPQGKSTVCLTGDGVLLRALTEMAARPGLPQGGTMRMEATEVRYGAPEASRFTVPQGYQTMQAPAGMPGAPGGAPGAAPGGAPAR
ncbi:Domain of unknown function [Roseomonas rosea]|uniref:DUF4412 domain-containing protein n=1 Tax=Muricoccus roseus TaxID=198092 RepID=A0A1M6JZK0_9PROT|nr:DUF4412 domain-containing protein [Roseomonas rosea]SHJ52022.1 Domain of unknown function [Roseomonas rosea]